QQLKHPFEPDRQSPGKTGWELQPVDPLGHPPAAEAIDSADGHLQQDTLITQIAVTTQAKPALMNKRAESVATSAVANGTALRLELDQRGVVGGWATGCGVIAWPESGKINRMHGDSRDRWMVGLATTTLPASLPVNPLFPPILRRTYL